MGDGAFMCSLYLSANVLPDFPMNSSPKFTLPHLYLYIIPLFCQMVSLSLDLIRRFLIVLPPLKCICMPCLLQWHRYMRFVDVVGNIVPGVVGTSVGPVGFDVSPSQSPKRILASS